MVCNATKLVVVCASLDCTGGLEHGFLFSSIAAAATFFPTHTSHATDTVEVEVVQMSVVTHLSELRALAPLLPAIPSACTALWYSNSSLSCMRLCALVLALLSCVCLLWASSLFCVVAPPSDRTCT